jgi:hypothetical protein
MKKNNGWGGIIDMASTIFHKQRLELDGCGQQTGINGVLYGPESHAATDISAHFGHLSLESQLHNLQSGVAKINDTFKSGLKRSQIGASVLYVSFIEKINEDNLAYEVYRFFGGMPLPADFHGQTSAKLSSKNTN